jgi:hypothetical protein
MAGGMWLWSVISVLLAVPPVVVILKLSKKVSRGAALLRREL